MKFISKIVLSALSFSVYSAASSAESVPADHDFYKTVCVWNATGQTVRARMQFDHLDPYNVELAASSYTSYSWLQREGTVNTPPLQLWFQKGLTADTLSNAESPDAVLVPLNTEKDRDCSKLRRLPIHYKIGEVWDLETGAVKGYHLTGPMLDP